MKMFKLFAYLFFTALVSLPSAANGQQSLRSQLTTNNAALQAADSLQSLSSSASGLRISTGDSIQSGSSGTGTSSIGSGTDSACSCNNYTKVFGSYSYQNNLKVKDTSFLARLVTGYCSLDPSALAQFNSAGKGVLIPRLTTGQMDSINNPANGLLVYNVTQGCFFYFNNTAWVGMGACSGASVPSNSYWNITGNSGVAASSNYIGTADSNGLTLKTANTVFGHIDSLQQFVFSTQMDSDVYVIATSTNTSGIGLTGIFVGDQTAGTGFYEVDGRSFGFSKHVVLLGDTANTHIVISDSLMVLQSDSLLFMQSASLAGMQAPDGVFIGSNAGVAINGNVVAIFGQSPSSYSNNVSDSSNVGGELMTGWNYIGGNDLSGGMSLGTNIILGDGSSITGNNMVGHGVINGLYPGMSENFITGNSHIDSNYLEGAVLVWNLGRGADNSRWSNNYLKNLSSEVNLQDISGQYNENVVADTITGNNSGISGITLLGQDSIAFNSLSAPGTNIHNLVMQNSNINYCNLDIPNAGINSSQFYNSNILHVNNQINNSTFYNVYKDFSLDSIPWNNIMLLNDNVGIGINSKPTATLQIGDSSDSQSLRYVDGNQGAGKVLTSDNYGNATWQPSTGAAGAAWGLYGNSGTTTAANYLGTADYNGLNFKTNNSTFGVIDPLQHFNFYTNMDSAVYGVQTTANIGGFGVNGIFFGNQTAGLGVSVIDGASVGASGPILTAGSLSGTHITIQDSSVNMRSKGSLIINSQTDEELNCGGGSLHINGQQIAANAPLLSIFNPTILPDNIADSSKAYANIVLDGSVYGNNSLSGGAVIGENILYDAGSSCVGNTLIGAGSISGWFASIASNQLHVATHLDSNYLEGASQIQDVGKHSHFSNFCHNYLKSALQPVQIYGVSGESNENVVWDSLTDGNGIYNLTLLNLDSVAYNTLHGANINNLLMQNSDLNYCHFLSPGKGFGFSQLFNSRIVNDTVSVGNCFFHNVNKDFSNETQDWSYIMLLNDNVGIGIVSKPTASFQIGDSANTRSFRYVDGNQGEGKILISDSLGNATWRSSVLLQKESIAYFTPGARDSIAPGDSITLSDTVSVSPYYYNIIDSTGPLTNLTIELPASPVDGEWVEVKLAQSGMALHYLNGNVANSAPTFIQSGNFYIKLVFRAASSKWY